MSTWILLRGLTREVRHWGDFPRQLAARVPDARIRGIDLPGNGILCATPSPLHVSETLASVRARAGTPPFTVLGLSLGGMVAAEWAHRYPAELNACILVNSGMRPYGAFHERLRPRSYAALMRAALQWQRHAAVERIVWRLTSSRPADPALLADWMAWRREAPVTASNALRQLWAAAHYCAPQALDVPVLVVGSHGDRLVSPSCSQRTATAWHAPLRMHPAAGHDLPLDDPAWLAATIADWLAELLALSRRSDGAPRSSLR